jgi:hypothetical protein
MSGDPIIAVHYLALAGLHAGVLLVDHINPAVAADHSAVFVAELGRLKAVADLHDTLGENG